MRHDQKIKPLVWEKWKEGSWCARGLGINYDIELDIDSGFSLFNSTNPFPIKHPTLKEAKAAAQADFERRIREWLKP